MATEKKDLRFEAASVANAMHKGQMYGDRPYFSSHVTSVVAVTRQLGGDETAECVAYLHDVIEDTGYSLEELRNVFGNAIFSAVVAISKFEGESYESYMQSVLLNKYATLVKKADTLCNLQQSMREGDAKRIAKYIRQLAILHGVEL